MLATGSWSRVDHLNLIPRHTLGKGVEQNTGCLWLKVDSGSKNDRCRTPRLVYRLLWSLSDRVGSVPIIL
jgi:hypothetical protein